MGEFSVTHWLVVLAIVVLLFGPSRLPDLGAGLGNAIKNFRKGLREANPTTPPEPEKTIEEDPNKKV